MAMEYIYLDHTTEQPVNLKKFKNLMYRYEEWSCDEGFLELVDCHNNHVASFQVKHGTCYVLQRRNQSALQLHEVTPPRVFRDRTPWLFGFGNKHRCNSQGEFWHVCEGYRSAHPNCEFFARDVNCNGSYLMYAFAVGDYATPVAYYCKWAESTAWAFFGDETICEFVATVHRDLSFKYPLQFVVHQVKVMATLAPVRAKEFFQEKLGIYDEDVYYAYEFGGF